MQGNAQEAPAELGEKRCAKAENLCYNKLVPFVADLLNYYLQMRFGNMLKTEIVTLEQAGELDAFVMSHPEGHFEQVSGWGRLKGWPWRGILCRDASGRITGSMAILMHKIRGTKFHMLYAPRGPVTDRQDFQTLETLIGAAKELAKEFHGYLLRIDPPVYDDQEEYRQEIRKLGFSIDVIDDFSGFNPRMVYLIDLKDKTPEQVLAGFHSRTRYNIRLSQRKGVTIEERGPESAGEFNQMMLNTAKKDGFHSRGEEYYRRVLECFPDTSKMLFAMYEGRPVSGSISIQFGPHTWSLFTGSTNELACKPNEPLKWADISWAIEGGSEIYDFRGVKGYPTEDNPDIGLHKFKQGFGAEFKTYMGQMDLPLKPLAAKLIPKLQKLMLRLRG